MECEKYLCEFCLNNISKNIIITHKAICKNKFEKNHLQFLTEEEKDILFKNDSTKNEKKLDYQNFNDSKTIVCQQCTSIIDYNYYSEHKKICIKEKCIICEEFFSKKNIEKHYQICSKKLNNLNFRNNCFLNNNEINNDKSNNNSSYKSENRNTFNNHQNSNENLEIKIDNNANNTNDNPKFNLLNILKNNSNTLEINDKKIDIRKFVVDSNGISKVVKVGEAIVQNQILIPVNNLNNSNIYNNSNYNSHTNINIPIEAEIIEILNHINYMRENRVLILNSSDNLHNILNQFYRQGKGMDKDDLKNLQEFKYIKPSNIRPEETEKCNICISVLETNEILRKLVCSHMFHKECIDTWLVQNAICPTCKYQLK